jgi:glycosyltransferase involved in cell wall biosynthesis
VTSGRQTYQIDEADDVHRALYDRARAAADVEYVGPLSQTALAELAGRSDALLYPSIFGETGCIAAIEAMAAGLRVVATDLAALPETGAGFAMLVRSGSDPEALARSFAATVISDWRAALAQPQAYVAQRIAQQRFVRAVHDWNRIATMWESWLRERGDLPLHRPGIADRPAQAVAAS